MTRRAGSVLVCALLSRRASFPVVCAVVGAVCGTATQMWLWGAGTGVWASIVVGCAVVPLTLAACMYGVHAFVVSGTAYTGSPPSTFGAAAARIVRSGRVTGRGVAAAARYGHPTVREAAAASPALTAGVARLLAGDDDWWVVRSVSHNPLAPDEVRVMVALRDMPDRPPGMRRLVRFV